MHRRCPVCGHDSNRKLMEKPGVSLVQCGECSMVYANPIPSEMASGTYYNRVGEEYYLSRDKLAGDYADVRFDRELRLFRRYCRGGQALDVGCSSGGFLFQLGKRFPGEYEAIGTDVSGPALDYAASKGVNVMPGDFLRLDVANLDAVTFWAVLEHLENPRAFLEKAFRILKPDGLCFVLVPNFASLASRLLGPKYRYIYPQHLNYFTVQTLIRLLDDRFKIVERRYTHFNPVVIWQDWRRGGDEVSNQERAALLARTNKMKASPLLGPARLLYRMAEWSLRCTGLADNIALIVRKR